MKKALIKEEVCNLLNKALGKELYVSNLYKHVANQLQTLGYFGTQKYFLGESAEELTHYQKIVDYLNDMGDTAKMPEVPAMTEKIGSIGDALKLAFDQEIVLMNFYASMCDKVDHITYQFLLQFIEIQRTSVGQYGDLIARYEKLAGDTCGFIIFDQEMNGL